MASIVLQVCQLIGVMLAVCVFTTSAQVCTSNGDCSNAKICWKYSDCDKGSCICAPNWVTNADGNCQEASTLLGKGDSCEQTSLTDRCDAYDDIACLPCPENPTTDYQCRSGAITFHVSIIAVLSPILVACFI